MAKLLKHLGIGVKKPTPKQDYSSLRSTGTDSSLPRSPTSEKSTTSLSTTASHIGEFEVAQLQNSPHRIVASEKGGGLSPKSSTLDRAALPSTDDSDAPAAGDSELEGAVGGTGATPGTLQNHGKKKPQLLDEYSDPADVRREIEEDMEYGACAPAMEDDYCVPYEVKKLFREMRLRNEVGDVDTPIRLGRKGPQMYPYEEGAAGISPLHRAMEPHNLDIRPKEDYDEPWDWSKQTKLLQSQLETAGHNIPPHFISNQNRTPQLQRTKLATQGSLDSEPDSDKLPHSMNTTGAYGDPYGDPRRTQSPQQQPDEENSDDEGYTHLREEFGPSGPRPPQEAAGPAPGPSTKNQRIGNYEEPWDLSAKQRELEDKFKAASDRASRERSVSNMPAPHETDKRPQEGYDKPWDWKPHQRDDRPQQGYDKPWDWKPHQKDDRPPEEYEEPWDQKAEELKRELMAAKICSKDGKKDDDSRPAEEYDEPWDNKGKKPTSRGGSSSDSSPKSSQSPVMPHPSNQSPKKKPKFNLDLTPRSWNTQGERVDPKVPLEQQGWHHGKISRVDAETLLRVCKEGSYLVRKSESNQVDFSLSLKSARGFMHMKIVNRDGKFILGQFSQPFDSIPQMIYHYSISKLPIKGAEHMSLLHPVINELL